MGFATMRASWGTFTEFGRMAKTKAVKTLGDVVGINFDGSKGKVILYLLRKGVALEGNNDGGSGFVRGVDGVGILGSARDAADFEYFGS